MALLLIYLGLALIPAIVAGRKGRSAAGFFLFAFVLDAAPRVDRRPDHRSGARTPDDEGAGGREGRASGGLGSETTGRRPRPSTGGSR